MAYVNIGEENEQVEFKKSTGELKEGVISIASILNKHDCGDLYFGVKNNGDVIGQEISDTTTRDVSQAIRANIKPPIYPVIEKQHYGDRDVVHVQFEGKRRPYVAYGIPRIRIADEDTQMDQELYREMLIARESRIDSWETKISKYHIGDIDKEAFDRYLKKAKEVGRIVFDSDNPADILTKLELTEGDMLLNAGAALFVDSGMNDLQMAKFATNEKLTFTDIRRHTGSIVGLVEIAMRYLIDAMDWRAEFHGKLERDEIPEVPVDALREAVINAFAHRQIESGQSIQIMIFKNRIEIYSPGTFPERISPEEFAEGNKKAIRRNRIITQTLYYSKDMETFATGLMKIRKLCSEAGVKYEFQREEYGFTVIFYRHCGGGWGWSGSQDDMHGIDKSANGIENGTDSGIEMALKFVETYNGSKKKNAIRIVLAIRKDKSRTIQQIADEAGVSKRTAARYIKEFQDAGVLTREGSDISGKWILS